MNSYPFNMTGLLLAPPPPPPPSVPPDVTAPTRGQQGPQDGPSRPPHPQAMHVMMIPPNHLSLPPPPPPPLDALDGSGLPGYHRMPCTRSDINAPSPNFVQHHNQTSEPHVRHPHQFRGGLSPWAPQKHVPSGLQGPWRAPNSERKCCCSGHSV